MKVDTVKISISDSDRNKLASIDESEIYGDSSPIRKFGKRRKAIWKVLGLLIDRGKCETKGDILDALKSIYPEIDFCSEPSFRYEPNPIDDSGGKAGPAANGRIIRGTNSL